MQEEKEQTLINPITGQRVDEIIKEKEARRRGYFELEFLLKYLEDDNEFVKYFVHNGKKIIVDMEKPYLQYKKPTAINHERVIQEVEEKKKESNLPNISNPATCNIDDASCECCSG